MDMPPSLRSRLPGARQTAVETGVATEERRLAVSSACRMEAARSVTDPPQGSSRARGVSQIACRGLPSSNRLQTAMGLFCGEMRGSNTKETKRTKDTKGQKGKSAR